MAKSTCIKCGYQMSDLPSLIRISCNKGGKHEPYEGPESRKYTCIKCGYQMSDLPSLIRGSCSKGGNHVPY